RLGSVPWQVIEQNGTRTCAIDPGPRRDSPHSSVQQIPGSQICGFRAIELLGVIIAEEPHLRMRVNAEQVAPECVESCRRISFASHGSAGPETLRAQKGRRSPRPPYAESCIAIQAIPVRPHGGVE